MAKPELVTSTASSLPSRPAGEGARAPAMPVTPSRNTRVKRTKVASAKVPSATKRDATPQTRKQIPSNNRHLACLGRDDPLVETWELATAARATPTPGPTNHPQPSRPATNSNVASAKPQLAKRDDAGSESPAGTWWLAWRRIPTSWPERSP